jgi:hypothetical protein
MYLLIKDSYSKNRSPCYLFKKKLLETDIQINIYFILMKMPMNITVKYEKKMFNEWLSNIKIIRSTGDTTYYIFPFNAQYESIH